MSETNKTIMKRFINDYQVGDDQQVLYATVSPTLVNHTPMFPDAPGGPAEVKTIFDLFHAAFTDFGAEVLDQLAEGDKVFTYKAFTGTHTGDFLGVAPTGAQVRFEVMDIVRIADGQIVEHWGLVDQLSLLRQLGATSSGVA
ncbi:ester cyclase [Kribbella sp. NPDC059898]|uniref:ester cyclase n=1 Tax=Kribbella sp. NPDC059898 TaxID=3346995 RepID=UPI00364A0650